MCGRDWSSDVCSSDLPLSLSSSLPRHLSISPPLSLSLSLSPLPYLSTSLPRHLFTSPPLYTSPPLSLSTSFLRHLHSSRPICLPLRNIIEVRVNENPETIVFSAAHNFVLFCLAMTLLCTPSLLAISLRTVFVCCSIVRCHSVMRLLVLGPGCCLSILGPSSAFCRHCLVLTQILIG